MAFLSGLGWDYSSVGETISNALSSFQPVLNTVGSLATQAIQTQKQIQLIEAQTKAAKEAIRRQAAAAVPAATPVSASPPATGAPVSAPIPTPWYTNPAVLIGGATILILLLTTRKHKQKEQ